MLERRARALQFTLTGLGKMGPQLATQIFISDSVSLNIYSRGFKSSIPIIRLRALSFTRKIETLAKLEFNAKG